MGAVSAVNTSACSSETWVPMNNGEMVRGLEQCVRFLQPRLGRDPMPRGRNIYEVKRGHGQLRRLEGSIDNLNVGVPLQPVAGDARHIGAKLNTGNAIAHLGKQKGCLSTGALSRSLAHPRNPARRTSSWMSRAASNVHLKSMAPRAP